MLTQAAGNLPSSLVAAASAFGSKSGPKELTPAYGVVYRFSAQSDEIGKDLGRWQFCGGLKVDFAPVEVRNGGNYVGSSWLAGEAKYGKVTLRRAVDPDSSKAVQDWLKKAGQGWIEDQGKDFPGSVTITLYDAASKPVLAWQLHGVRPSAWSTSDLDANSSKVAIESLELVHEGFEVTTGKGGAGGGKSGSGQGGWTKASPSAQPKWGRLSLAGPGGLANTVNFWNTPTKIQVKRTSEALTLPLVAGETTDEEANALVNAGTKVDTTKLVMNDLYIVKRPGVDPVKMLDLMIGWMGTKGDSKTPEIKPTPVNLKWGRFDREVLISELSAEYNRFDTNAVPTRAKISSLTLTVIPKPGLSLTNPTSGGIPGRGAHLLTLDENLPLLAQERYGTPARWRDIAEANGIDDPLRMRPGRQVFLPAAEEFPGRGGPA